jgi:hypothetical protein
VRCSHSGAARRAVWLRDGVSSSPYEVCQRAAQRQSRHAGLRLGISVIRPRNVGIHPQQPRERFRVVFFSFEGCGFARADVQIRRPMRRRFKKKGGVEIG